MCATCANIFHVSIRTEKGIVSVGNGAAPAPCPPAGGGGKKRMRLGEIYKSVSKKEPTKYCWLSPVWVIWFPRKLGEWLWNTVNGKE